MGAETKIATIYKERPERFVIPSTNTVDTVSLYGETEDSGEQFAIDTEVVRCNLENGQTVQVTFHDTVFDKDGKPVTLPAPMVQGVWGERCVYCKFNPYLANSVKQCNACRKPT